MSTLLPPLREVLRQVPDPRMRRGRRHPLAALLALACAAIPSAGSGHGCAVIGPTAP